MKIPLLLASVVAALVLAGGAVSAAIPPGAGDADGRSAGLRGEAARRDAALDRALEELVAMRGGPPGVIAVVQRGRHREIHSFGVANVSTGRRMEAGDRMRVASTAKAFSGAAALSLVSRRELSLGDTIGRRLPDLPAAWSTVTLRQLLNHTSGLPDFSQVPAFQDAVRANPTRPLPPDRLLSFVENRRPLFEPGSRYRYSNSDNIVVALMVEDATGGAYEEQLRELVYGPLGLGGTSLPSGPDLGEPFIHGYDPAQRPPEDVSEVLAAGWAWASGGIVSTPADLNDFVRGYVGGRLFDPRTLAEQRRVTKGGRSEPPGPGKNSAGLALFRYRTGCGTVWGHTGNTLGYTQFMAASSDGRRSVTVSVNAQLTPTEGAPGVFEALRRSEARAVCAALADG